MATQGAAVAAVAVATMVAGVKGSDVYASTGSKVLDLYIMLNRGLLESEIRTAVDSIVATGDKAQLEDAFVLLFQTRDIRGGKGERKLFEFLWAALATHRYDVSSSLFDLVPEYGCWQDLLPLATGPAKLKIYDLMLKQLQLDEQALASYAAAVAAAAEKDAQFPALGGSATPVPSKPKLSLVAKWLPREHSNRQEDRVHASALAKQANPSSRAPQAEYRKRVTAVNKALDTLEITLCGGQWATIDPSKVPGRARKQYRGAFLNKVPRGRPHGRKEPSTDPDRIACAERFVAHNAKAKKGEAKVNGADTVFPHELVKVAISGQLDEAERDATEAQWRAIWDKVRATGTLGRTLAMSDFSGSMASPDATPLHVSMALGLGIAECNTGIFKGHLLTFDSTPTLHKFTAEGFCDRLAEVEGLAQGLSTDFQAAYNLILEHLKRHAVPPGQEPTDLIVLTDMGFDAASRAGSDGWYSVDGRYNHAVKTKDQETHAQIARRAFRLAGETLWGEGKGWQAPRIVIWNLRAAYNDFQATAMEEGVIQVSGWSPSLLRVLMTQGVDAMKPNAMLRVVLDDPRYNLVRSRVHALLNSPPKEEAVVTYWGC